MINSDFIDFDAPDIDCNDFETNLEFPLEHDVVNLGSWILLSHPNFFIGSTRANIRYALYLLNVIIILSIQFLLYLYFNITALNESLQNYDVYFEIMEKGPTILYS